MNLNTITALATFCINVSEAINENKSAMQLHSMTLDTAASMQINSGYDFSAKTLEEYGEIMNFLVPILTAKNLDETRAKMIALSMELMAASERHGEAVHIRLGDELMRL
ncbi:hypothetical protein [Enterobacter vonholyi]